MRTAMIVCLVLFATSCTSAHEGTPCDGWPMCQDPTTALFCVNGNYRGLPCPGPNGCRDTAEQGERVIACDLRGIQPGDQCPDFMLGFVYCLTATSALRCNGLDMAAKSCPTLCETGTPGIGTLDQAGTCD